MEWIKTLSDKLIVGFLKVTSSFGRELTRAGRLEQEQWREQRLRNLNGLAIRWQQRRTREKKPS